MTDYKIADIIIIDNDEKKEFEDLTIYSDTINEYFIGYKITELLGYKNPKSAITNSVSKNNEISFRNFTGIKEPKLNPRTILITRDGVIEILSKTRKTISTDIINFFNKYGISLNKKIEDCDSELIINSNTKELTKYSYQSDLMFEYFVGYEISALVGYKNPADVIAKNVSKSNQLEFRDYPGPKIPEINPKTILITRDGAIEILLKTRKRISADVLHLLKEFHIETSQ